jgi:AcrR family transcriptional regulator
MFIEMKKRRYDLKKRAESQGETRARIVAAAMRLHEEVGPKATTISAVADRAGVQRLTVYRHFPTEDDLFQACTSHWLELNPPPDPAAWSNVTGLERCRAALNALYAYYRGTSRMWEAAYRDEKQVPALQAPMGNVLKYLGAIADDLCSALSQSTRANEQHAVVAHALQFSTWRSLSRDMKSDAAMADLVVRWIAAT